MNPDPRRELMSESQTNAVSKELWWLVLIVCSSLLIWCALALVVDQNLIVKECVYDKELIGFSASIGFFYLLRFTA